MKRLLPVLMGLVVLFLGIQETYAYDSSSLQRLKRTHKCPHCLLQEASFLEADLRGADFYRANLQVEMAGGYYSPDFSAHFADIDLSLRVWQAGGRCEPVFPPLLREFISRNGVPELQTKLSSYKKDKEVFVEKWRESFGRGWSTKVRSDFCMNIKIGPVLDKVLNDGTIFINDPRFCDIIRKYYDQCGIPYIKDKN